MNEHKHTCRTSPKNTLNSSVISQRDYHKNVIKKPRPVKIVLWVLFQPLQPSTTAKSFFKSKMLYISGYI